MKNSIFTFGAIMTVILITSCSTRRKLGNHQILIEDPIDQTIVIPYSTKEPGYDPYQRAFSDYLRSLGPEERNKWVSQGSFTEQEKNNLLNKIDSMKNEKELDTLKR